MDARQQQTIINILRRGWLKWPARNLVLKEARANRGKYKCNGCGQVVPRSVKKRGKTVMNIAIDHIIPVVDPEKGFVDWNEYIRRLYVTPDKLQLLCKPCHDTKTKKENAIRRANAKS